MTMLDMNATNLASKWTFIDFEQVNHILSVHTNEHLVHVNKLDKGSITYQHFNSKAKISWFASHCADTIDLYKGDG